MPVDAVHDLAVHLDQAAVGVVGEARVAGRRSQALDRDVVEAEVEDRVHHPRHRDRRARAHRDEQRIGRVAEALARLLLERRDVRADLVVEARRHLLAARHVGATRVGRDREPGRHGDAERRHLGETDALAAEELPAARGLFVVVVDVAHGQILAQAPRIRACATAHVSSCPCAAQRLACNNRRDGRSCRAQDLRDGFCERERQDDRRPGARAEARRPVRRARRARARPRLDRDARRRAPPPARRRSSPRTDG